MIPPPVFDNYIIPNIGGGIYFFSGRDCTGPGGWTDAWRRPPVAAGGYKNGGFNLLKPPHRTNRHEESACPAAVFFFSAAGQTWLLLTFI